jgi:hypothetical protein
MKSIVPALGLNDYAPHGSAVAPLYLDPCSSPDGPAFLPLSGETSGKDMYQPCNFEQMYKSWDYSRNTNLTCSRRGIVMVTTRSARSLKRHVTLFRG